MAEDMTAADGGGLAVLVPVRAEVVGLDRVEADYYRVRVRVTLAVAGMKAVEIEDEYDVMLSPDDGG